MKYLLVVFLVIVSGCSPVVLHPIEDIDIIRVKRGGVLTAPKDGYFLSNLYFEEVLKAKVE